MGEAAACGARQHDFSRKTELRQDIQEGLQETRIGSLVRGCRDHDPPCVFDRLYRVCNFRGGYIATQKRLRGQVTQSNVPRREILASHFVEEVLRHACRLRGRRGTTGQSEDRKLGHLMTPETYSLWGGR